jgi:hypothetical protein
MATSSFHRDAAARTIHDLKALLPTDRAPVGALVDPSSDGSTRDYVVKFLGMVGAEVARPPHMRVDYIKAAATVCLEIDGRPVVVGLLWMSADADHVYAHDTSDDGMYVASFPPGGALHFAVVCEQCEQCVETSRPCRRRRRTCPTRRTQ